LKNEGINLNKLSVLVSTGNLGDNIIEKNSFYEGLKHHLDYIAADAGTADAGPTFLGADMPHNPLEWEQHDLELILLACRERKIPMIIGSCSTTGTDQAVDRYAGIVRNLAQKYRLSPFKMALIYSQLSKEELSNRLARQEIEPLGANYLLSQEDIDKTSNITASMGVEQIIYALENGADVILAGRSCDDAVIAAYPIFKGFPKGISLHLGKAAECASLVCWPQMVKESIIGTVTDDYFLIEPMHPAQRATSHSVAAHSMYERTNPFVQAVPGGILDMHNSIYEMETDRICKVSNSVFLPSPDGKYKVKLEGAGPVGHRVYHFVGIRDPIAIQNIDKILVDTRLKVAEIMSPKQDGKDYHLYFHVYGKNAIMQNIEPIAVTNSHEVGIMIEAISSDIELSTTVVKCAKFRFFYMSYPGQKNSSGGSVALLTDEPLYPKNLCYQWTIDHLLTLDNPLDDKIFKFSFEIVGE
jgi:hypothetical protein